MVQVALQRRRAGQLLQRDLAIDQARWTLNRADRRPRQRPDRGGATCARRPTCPPSARRSAWRTRDNPVAARLARGAAAPRGDSAPRSSAAACRASPRAARIDYSQLGHRRSRSASAPGSSASPGTSGPTRGARRRSPRRASRRERNRHRARARAARARGGRALTQRRRRGAARRARPRREAAVGQAEENLRIRQQQFDAGRAQSEDVLDAEATPRRRSAPRSRARSTRRTRAAPSCSG